MSSRYLRTRERGNAMIRFFLLMPIVNVNDKCYVIRGVKFFSKLVFARFV